MFVLLGHVPRVGLGGAWWVKNFRVGICSGAPSTAQSCTVLETLWEVEKTCFSPHTGGTAGAIFDVLGCEFRDPVLVENRSNNSFYGHPFPSAVTIRAAISFLRKSGHSILIYHGTM